MNDDDEETKNALYFLGLRRIVPFQMGSSRYVRIFRTPSLRSPSITENFCKFLNARPSNPIRYPHIGTAFTSEIHYHHIRTRNCLSARENWLLEGSGASIRLIINPLIVDSWSKFVPSISTRSTCTSLSINSQLNFGIATTLNGPMLFSLIHDPVSRFMSTTFLEPDKRNKNVNQNFANSNDNDMNDNYFNDNYLNQNPLYDNDLNDDQLNDNSMNTNNAYSNQNLNERGNETENENRSGNRNGITTDAKVSQFINGESLTISSFGELRLYSQDKVLFQLDIPENEEYFNSSIEFGCHPRVVTASFKDRVQIFDLRLSNPNLSQIYCQIPEVASILPIDNHQIAVGSMNGLDLIDLRFPTKSSTKFDYSFSSNPMSLFKRKFSDFDCVVAQCCESSETIFFPFNNLEFSAPLRPFDTILKPYDTLENEYLTGVAILNDTAIIQFESGSVVGIEMSNEVPPCRHFFSTIMREEDGKHRDAFKFQPHFSKLPQNDLLSLNDSQNLLDSQNLSQSSQNMSQIQNIKWDVAFPEVTTRPPSEMMYPSPEPENAEDNDITGYLIEEADALEFSEKEIPEALSLFWQSHITIARNTL
ncbi:hypothetical protein TRFO_40964 [Tritrichomonas foetus]|uniref:Uncharacterized protein n=1 Tax=Tritrichomonas foetus TaxID=1144522 RepID=A0A1J4J4W3_9EUKA|nr:hypothetical protein TRFO_40964 [Tritrichomonas foetus]|eukprot:OHS92707.1 hypothetical protein TRFO_40964 [Tritrichomonas foetus]